MIGYLFYCALCTPRMIWCLATGGHQWREDRHFVDGIVRYSCTRCGKWSHGIGFIE